MITVRLATHAMGARFEFVLIGEREALLRAAGEEALDEITLWHRRLSIFDRASTISAVNARAAHEPVPVDAETFELLNRCAALTERTGGAFDITIGAAMARWGFREASPIGRSTAPSLDDSVPRRRDEPARPLLLNPAARTIAFTSPGVAVDLGGVGKGWALDRAASLLRDRGVAHALLHGGTSSAIAIGAPPGADGWRIAVRRPDGDDASALARVFLRDAALGVSAPHGRTIRDAEGASRGHIIDPRTGEPTGGALLAAVVGPSATDADAWSTALIVLGERPDSLPPSYASIILAPDGEGRIQGDFHGIIDASHGSNPAGGFQE